VAKDATLLRLALGGAGQAARRLLGRLHDHEALAGEAHREPLAGGAAQQGAEAELLGPVEAGLQVGRPADGRLRVDVGRLVDAEHHRGALGGDRDPAVAAEDAVEQAGVGHHAGAADHLDVVRQ
jgi:hypothetical protein